MCVKFGVHAARYVDMRSVTENPELTALLMGARYRKLVADRLRRPACCIKTDCGEMIKVARRLKHSGLATLFVDAQFSCMPSDFCQEKFNRKYPPVSVVFGGRCWERYYEYVRRGVRDAH